MSYNQNKRRGGYQQRGGNKFHGGGPSRRSRLEIGQRGFLCTCNGFEKDSAKEAMNLLNEYADQLFGQEDWRQPDPQVEQQVSSEGSEAVPTETEKEPVKTKDDDEDGEEDISEALKKELDGMKQESRKPVRQQRFRIVDSGANNVIFISSSVPDPVLLVHTLLTDLKTTKVARSRYLQRLLPIQVTCKAYLDDISKAASTLFDKYFAEGKTTFAVIFKSRNHSTLTRDSVITMLADLVSLKNASNFADLSHPKLVVLVELIKGVCCLSVLPEYFELSKYNLAEIVAPPKEPKPAQAEGAEGSKEEKKEGETAGAEEAEASPAKLPKET